MKRWKHQRIKGVSIVGKEPPCTVYVVPQADYRKIMAVYRAAVAVDDAIIINFSMTRSEVIPLEALSKAIERAEK